MKKKLLSILTLLLCLTTGAWGTDEKFDFESGTVTDVFNVTNTGSASVSIETLSTYEWSSGKTISKAPTGSSKLLIATLGGTKGSSSSFVTKANYRLISSISMYIMSSDRGKTEIAVQISPKADFSSEVTNVQAQTTLSSTDFGNTSNGTMKQLTWDVANVSGYVRIILAQASGSSGKIMGLDDVTISYASGPTINTQPIGASYITGQTIAALTVEATASAGTLSYQWYSCGDANKTNAAAISGAISDSYTPTAAGFYYVTVTDDNGPVDSDVVEISISAASAPTISIDASQTNVTAGTSITLTATADGVPTPTLKWYVSDTEGTSAGSEIDGETGDTYTFNAVVGTKYYYAKAFNSQATEGVASNVVTISGTARTGCDLNQVVYSNGFDAFITDPDGETNGTIKAYYLSGTTAPTIASTNKSDGANYSLTGNTLTLTSEDGNTTKTYNVTLTAVDPYNEDGVTFNGTENWVVCAYGFTNASDRKGYKYQRLWKSSDPGNEWTRPKTGYTRIYMFMAPNTKVTLKSGCSSDRNIDVYVNSTKVVDNQKLGKNGGTVDVTGDSENAYLLGIYSHQTGGDGSIVSISVTGSEETVTKETITPGKTYTTYVPSHNLDFTSASNLTAYIATEATASTVKLTSVDKVPAGTPIIIKASTTGSPNVVNVATSTDDVSDNKLMMGDGTTTIGGNSKYDYILSDGKFYRAEEGTVAVGKAYLHLDADPAAGGEARELSIVFDESETTGVEELKNSKIEELKSYYNLNGQRVAQPTKGLYIVNGKKVIMK